MALQLDYFYGNESEQFIFYRIPKALFTEAHYRTLSIEARVLYGLLLDRMGLSLRNGWLDDHNRVYIIFTLDEAIDMLKFSHTKIVRLFRELEEIGLIERKKQGQGRPTLIYVKNFIVHGSVSDSSHKQTYRIMDSQERRSRLPKSGSHDFQKPEVMTSKMEKSRLPKYGSADFTNMEANNTEGNNTECIYTDPSIHPQATLTLCRASKRSRNREMIDEIDRCREEIKRNIGYDRLALRGNIQIEQVDGFVELMLEVCTCQRDTVRIGKNELPSQIVRDRLLSLEYEHICYVLDCFSRNSTRISNIKAYILTSLYNAPLTLSRHEESMGAYDAEHGFC